MGWQGRRRILIDQPASLVNGCQHMLYFRIIESYSLEVEVFLAQGGQLQAQQFLIEQMEEFFFGSGSALPSEYVPPSQ